MMQALPFSILRSSMPAHCSGRWFGTVELHPSRPRVLSRMPFAVLALGAFLNSASFSRACASVFATASSCGTYSPSLCEEGAEEQPPVS